jgi:hypothetical protein
VREVRREKFASSSSLEQIQCSPQMEAPRCIQCSALQTMLQRTQNPIAKWTGRRVRGLFALNVVPVTVDCLQHETLAG